MFYKRKKIIDASTSYYFFAHFRRFSYVTQDTKRRWFGETLWKYLRD
nr:MAG TPA: hypothetical protein [Caudoviricetes sp.]